MITSIECSDFEKQYLDDFDCKTKSRNESCKHYEIYMKLYAKDGKFEKYKITFCCKRCSNEFEHIFSENSKRFEHQCLKCKNSIIFSYINTLEDQVNQEELNRKKRKENEEEYNKYKFNIYNEQYFENCKGRGEKAKNYPGDNNNPYNIRNDNNNCNNNKFQNNGIDAVQGIANNKHNVKIYSTPLNNDNNQTNSRFSLCNCVKNNQINPKIYITNQDNKNNSLAVPQNDSNNNHTFNYQAYENQNSAPSCSNYNNNTTNRKKLTFCYNNKKTKIELNLSQSMGEQYDIIQREMNLKKKKKIYLNGIEVNQKKLSEIKDLEYTLFEIEDD